MLHVNDNPSMEGLYFEASATTPYHFLLQSELSASPSAVC